MSETLEASRIEPPEHLGEESRQYWIEISQAVMLDRAAAIMLQIFFEARENRAQAREMIRLQGGPVLLDRFNQQKLSAWHAVERDNTLVMGRAYKDLGLHLPADLQGKLFG